MAVGSGLWEGSAFQLHRNNAVCHKQVKDGVDLPKNRLIFSFVTRDCTEVLWNKKYFRGIKSYQ